MKRKDMSVSFIYNRRILCLHSEWFNCKYGFINIYCSIRCVLYMVVCSDYFAM